MKIVLILEHLKWSFTGVSGVGEDFSLSFERAVFMGLQVFSPN